MNVSNNKNQPLSLHEFKEMDTLAVEHFGLPIELMMENAGLQLARRIVAHASVKNEIIIGAGNGNNGGGGWDKWATYLVNPDFAEYAESCGAKGIKVTDRDNLIGAMIQLFEHEGPALLEICTDVKLV
ncbi:MAG: thiamine pyrophosphate-dependent enzyme [Gracilimonas sp.]|nr:thiamine pyrophosphate-dependent enzyme [Gracilimonas sp.]